MIIAEKVISEDHYLIVYYTIGECALLVKDFLSNHLYKNSGTILFTTMVPFILEGGHMCDLDGARGSSATPDNGRP